MPSVLQDQKILELMLAKREEQLMEQERMEQAHRKWDAERERSSSAGALRGKERRSVMSGDRRLREQVSALSIARLFTITFLSVCFYYIAYTVILPTITFSYITSTMVYVFVMLNSCMKEVN